MLSSISQPRILDRARFLHSRDQYLHTQSLRTAHGINDPVALGSSSDKHAHAHAHADAPASAADSVATPENEQMGSEITPRTSLTIDSIHPVNLLQSISLEDKRFHFQKSPGELFNRLDRTPYPLPELSHSRRAETPASGQLQERKQARGRHPTSQIMQLKILPFPT